MIIEDSQKENIDFISDFLLRLSRISGNASLEVGKGQNSEHYLVNVENENGEYISYHTNAWLIQNALHRSARNIFQRALSTKKIGVDDYYNIHMSYDAKEYQGNLIKVFSNDNYPWEAIDALPLDLMRKVQMSNNEIAGLGIDESKKEIASKLSSELYDRIQASSEKSDETNKNDRKEESQKEVLTKLVADIAGISGNVSINMVDGRYYISTPTKDGHYMIYSTTDRQLESGDSNIFAVRKSTKELDMETLKTELNGNLSLLDGKECTLMQHDATIREIEANLSRNLDSEEHTASEISDDLQEIGRTGLTESALAELVNGQNTKDTRREEK